MDEGPAPNYARCSGFEKIYDLPCEESRPQTPEAKSQFQKLRDNFEKPKKTTVPLKIWKSSENVSKDFRIAKIAVEKKFSTDVKRYRKNVSSLPKRDNQLDVDRENKVSTSNLVHPILETNDSSVTIDSSIELITSLSAVG
ncbi:hypothetical protein KGM_214420 [Danaus plexippus plexippus]|uniref:Uncharacterized protein n=1 Tax=Danaus plexippus plexippus TaxID=278856 RepID=A0A212EVG3_DANPL|nr:hypothetical protein KGM_214420 [Danaus plexippus plexippus]